MSRTLNNDEIILIGRELDLPTLLKFCETCKKVKSLLCDSDTIWGEKLLKDFPDFPDYERLHLSKSTSFKETYCLLYKLENLNTWVSQLKNIFKLSIYNFYILEHLNLSNQEIVKLPKEIGVLKCLKSLYLINNKLTHLPREIGNLSHLETLDLSRNYLIEIPKEIGNLKKLRYLNVHNNKLLNLPTELGNLPLGYLDVSDNIFLKKLPLIPNASIKY